MKYPVDAITAKDKTEYLYATQEFLRLLNNKMVEWHEDGLTRADYNTFPEDIKKKYGFVNSIGLVTLKRFINEDFMPRSATICLDITVERSKLSKADKEEIMGIQGVDGEEGTPGTKQALKESTRWAIDAGTIEKMIK